MLARCVTVHHLCVFFRHPVGAAMGPVERQFGSNGATQQVVDRHAQRPRLDVQHGIFDGGDGLLIEASVSLPCYGIEFLARQLVPPDKVRHRQECRPAPR